MRTNKKFDAKQIEFFDNETIYRKFNKIYEIEGRVEIIEDNLNLFYTLLKITGLIGLGILLGYMAWGIL